MITYEWDVETLVREETEEHEQGEVLDHHHTNTFAEAVKVASGKPPENCLFQIVLVRDDDKGRSWAYVEGGQLADQFEDTYSNPVAKVPQRFIREVNQK